jgi:P63C domain
MAPLRATHKGNFREHFGMDVDCYVLDDEAKTAVISQRGMGAALGLGESGGQRFTRLLEGQAIKKAAGPEILEKAQKPLIFQYNSPGGSEQPPSVIHGYDVALLIDFCRAVLTARAMGNLGVRYDNVVKQAQIIISASAKSGIKGLVYALAGYDASREDIIASFKRFVAEEAREYEREFPDQLYQEWYRIYGLPQPERNHPWKFKQLTIDQVYRPLAKSNGRILELARIQKAKGKTRHSKLHQFLSLIGVKALRTHLGQLLGIAQLSETKVAYERNFEKVFKEQIPLDLD